MNVLQITIHVIVKLHASIPLVPIIVLAGLVLPVVVNFVPVSHAIKGNFMTSNELIKCHYYDHYFY